MIWTIARKELTELSRDGRFRLLAAVILLLAVASTAAGWLQFTAVSRQHAEAQRETREQWLNQKEKNPHSAAHYGMYAFKPASHLSIVDTGLDPYLGVAVWLEAHRQSEMKFRPAQDRTAVQRFGDLNGAEVLLVLVPLFILLVTFPVFAAEREQGTLRQLLSLGVPPRVLVAGKALGTLAGVGLVIVPVAALVALALGWASAGSYLAADASRTLALGATCLLYFLVVTGIGLAVSAWAPSSRVALVLLLGFWFATSLVAPRIAADVAASRYPTPNAAEFQRALDVELNDPEEARQRMATLQKETMARYNVTSLDALPVAFSGISLQSGEEHGNEVFDRHFGRLHDQFSAQARFFQWAGVASPLLAARSLSMALAGTDFEQHRHFARAAEEYRRDIQRTLNDDIARNQRAGQPYLAGSELWNRVPDFTYDAPSIGWVLGRQSTALAILAGWGLLAAGLALLAARRLTSHLG